MAVGDTRSERAWVVAMGALVAAAWVAEAEAKEEREVVVGMVAAVETGTPVCLLVVLGGLLHLFVMSCSALRIVLVVRVLRFGGVVCFSTLARSIESSLAPLIVVRPPRDRSGGCVRSRRATGDGRGSTSGSYLCSGSSERSECVSVARTDSVLGCRTAFASGCGSRRRRPFPPVAVMISILTTMTLTQAPIYATRLDKGHAVARR